MSAQEDLIKQQVDERKQAQQAQDALTKKLAEDHRQQNEQIQRQQDQMNEAQRRHQESLDQAAQQALEIQSRQRELGQQPVDGGKDPLDAQRERMEKAAEQCHELAKQSDEVAKQIQANQEQQQKIAGVLDDQNQPESMHKVATERQEKTLQEAQALQDQHTKLGQDFNAQNKLFDASQNGFNQERDQQVKLLNEAQERLQAETQRQAQARLDEQNKLSREQLGNISEDMEKRQAETLGTKWKNPDQPSGQQFEAQLEKTGELNNRLVEVEKRHGEHHPYQQPDNHVQPVVDNGGRQQVSDPHAQSNQLIEDSRLRPESAGDRNGQHVQAPSAVDAKVNKVQDNWSQHEQQQQRLIREIRGHEIERAEVAKQLQDNIDRNGDYSGRAVEDGWTPEKVREFNAIKKSQEDLIQSRDKMNDMANRKIGEFKMNESDFQRQSWDRVAKMAELSGDQDLARKAQMKSDEMRQGVDSMKQALDAKYGPKQDEPQAQKQAQAVQDYKISSDSEIKNQHSPVSPNGITQDMVSDAKEQHQKIATREVDRQAERHTIGHQQK